MKRRHCNVNTGETRYYEPYSSFPCTKKLGMPIQIVRIWKGPFALKGQRAPNGNWLNKKNFYAEHVEYFNQVTEQHTKTARKKVLLSPEERWQYLSQRQAEMYRSICQ